MLLNRLLFILGTWIISQTLTGQTRLVLLGTGTPNPDPEHSGCSIAVLVNNQAYIVDCGPGLVRQAARMSPAYGGRFEALSAKNLRVLFLTHLHSDHTAGLPDLMLTPWVMGRSNPLQVIGPPRTKNLVRHLSKAYSTDIRYRINGGEPSNKTGWRTLVNEIKNEGEVYRDSLVKVEAFKVLHGTMQGSFGYRFTTHDRVIVISGDTRPSDNLISYAMNCDILVHEVYSYARWIKRTPDWQDYHKAHHTSGVELGELAAKANPGQLVVYHLLLWGATEKELLDEIGDKFKGKVQIGRDLMVIE